MKSQEQKMNQNTLKSQVQNDPRSTKSLQFRNIAPKAPMAGPGPAVLPCRGPSSLPEATTPVSPRSIVVPAQNYALMQVAGQEGTYSLVALPTSVSSQSPSQPQIVQRDTSADRNMKLPIPRYRPTRIKGTPEKAKLQEVQVSSSKVAQQTRGPAQVRPKDHVDACSTLERLEPVPLRSPDIVSTALLTENLGPGTETGKDAVDTAKANIQASGAPSPPIPVPAMSGNNSSIKPEDGSPNKQCLTELTLPPAARVTTTILSPTVFSKAVRFVPSPPKGKLPILPYPRKKGVDSTVAKLQPKCPEPQPCLVNTLPIATTASTATQETRQKSTLNSMRMQDTDFQSMGPCTLLKKRAKKRKAFEDMTFEARKKRSLSFSRRRVPEKPTPASQNEKIANISKKYRSIMPKPLLMWEVPPQLVAVSSVPAPQHLGQEFVLSEKPSNRTLDFQQSGHTSVKHGPQRAVVSAHVNLGSRFPHRCPVCGRCFRFRNHLQGHMRIHTNGRQHGNPACRKSHSGSLNTQAKLHHHAESRPRNTLLCQFCEKAFGYVGVYFSHLREVHKVILTVEPSISQHEDDIPVEGMMSPDSTEEQGHEQEDPVELQIKCARCQATTPTFADMRLHLLHVHQENVPLRPLEGARRGCRQAEDELVRHAAHYWRELNERKNLATGNSFKVEDEEEEEDELLSFSKVTCDISSHHRGQPDGADIFTDGSQDPASGHTEVAKDVSLRAGSAFNCVLCSALLSTKEELLNHWESWHHCSDPTLLWKALNCFLGPGRPKQEVEEETF
uniref:Zinc finger protein 438 n=1 Tax=Paramormyrops kingsleyae TaxID=1676925 RepID=A0A3B3SGS4_9TELE|nr:zinc finger protein 438-like isoform X1 [Paramormyrops kingsleyae]